MDDLRQRDVTVMVATHDLDQAAERFDRVLLINRRLLGFGTPEEVLTSERLLQAYGGHLHVLQVGNDTLLALTDTCCDEGEGE
jgi:ABC-type Mn2+/Zn2+ transport system ATPase subunit